MSSNSETIRKIRDSLCMSQIEFGKFIGVTGQTIHYYEHDMRMPRRNIIRKLKDIADKNGIKFTVADFLVG